MDRNVQYLSRRKFGRIEWVVGWLCVREEERMGRGERGERGGVKVRRREKGRGEKKERERERERARKRINKSGGEKERRTKKK